MEVTIHSVLGILIVATWINSILFGIQILQGYRYFTTFRNEIAMGIVVALLFLIDVIAIVGQYVTVYLDAVNHFGDMAYLSNPSAPPRGMYLFGIQLSGAIVQSYLIMRVYRLSKNIYISVVLWLGVVLALAGGLGLSILNIIYPEVTERYRQSVPTSIWLITAAIIDVLIACILVYYLWKAKQKSSFAHTHELLTRIMKSTLETGSLTALLAIAVEITFETARRTNLPVGGVFLLGRAYSVTMLYSLNSRESLRNAGRSHSDSGAMSMPTRNAPARGGATRGLTETTTYPIEIQVAQTAVTDMDTDAHRMKAYREETSKPEYV